jgi:uncharacterized membrane protein
MEDARRLDEETDAAIGAVLLAGLLLSIAVMVLGLVLTAARGKVSASQVLPLDQVLPHLRSGDPAAVLDLGILLLFATPLAGVVVALFEFLRRRDGPFSVITLLLLLILAIGFAVALRAG